MFIFFFQNLIILDILILYYIIIIFNISIKYHYY